MGLNRLTQQLRTFRVLFLGVFAAIAVLILGVTALRTPKYTAVTTVMIEPRQQDISSDKTVLSKLPAESGVIDSEVRVLESREFAERVVRTLNLENDDEFHRPVAGETPALAFERTVDAVLRALTVRRSGLTYVIDIAFQSRSGDKSARIANEYARLYTSSQRNIKAQATEQASDLLQQRLQEMRGQLEQAEARVAEYRAAHGLLTADGQNVSEQQLADLNNRYVEARTTQADADARLASMRRQLQTDPTGGNIDEALKSETIRDLRAQRAISSAKVASLQSRLGARHPDLLAARQELTDIDAALKAELNRIMAGVSAQASIAASRSAAAGSALAGAKGTLASDNSASVKLNELERNAQSVRAVYESYLARFRETSTQLGMETADARVIAPAAPPLKPSSPNWPISIVLALVGGFVGGAGAVAVRARMERGLTSAQDTEEIFGLPVIGSLPTLSSAVEHPVESAPYDYVVERRRSLFAQTYMALVSALADIRVEGRGRIIALTSAIPDEGKSVTSLCLVRSMALRGESVVLVDADLDRQGLSRLIQTDHPHTLGDVLTGKATVEQALVYDSASGAWMLLSGREDANYADLLTGSAIEALLDDLRRRFDTVLLDTAPLLAIANTRDLVGAADAVVLLARWRHTARDDVYATLQILQRIGTRIAGIVLTRVDLRRVADYGYSPLRRYDGYHES